MPRIGAPRVGAAAAGWDVVFLRRRLVLVLIGLALVFLVAVAYRDGPPQLKQKKASVPGAVLGIEVFPRGVAAGDAEAPLTPRTDADAELPITSRKEAVAAASPAPTVQEAPTSLPLEHLVPSAVPLPADTRKPAPPVLVAVKPANAAGPSPPTWPREARICDATRCTGVRRVYSFSLFGAGSNEYTRGMVANARLMRDLMPDWECWVFLPGAGPPNTLVDNATVDALRDAGARLIFYAPSEEKPLGYGMKQRFLISGDPSVDRFAVRDSDARLLLRDREVEDVSLMWAILSRRSSCIADLTSLL